MRNNHSDELNMAKVSKLTKKKKLKNISPTDSHESSTTGRVAELFLGSILLSNGFEVYQPVVDVAIDYLAFNQKRSLLHIQCKSRSKENATVFDLSLPKDKRVTTPSHVFYMRGPADRAEYWIVPFAIVKKIAKRHSNPRGRTVFRVYMTEDTKRLLRDYRGEYGVIEAKLWSEKSSIRLKK